MKHTLDLVRSRFLPFLHGVARPTSHARIPSNQAHRAGLRIFFFMHGICFASWASRIPTIQSTLNLTEAALGTVLFALPLGFFISLPFSGWLISRIGSKRTVVIAAVCYSISLVLVGASRSTFEISIALLLFGFFANALNISMNTQAVAVEKLYKKRLMAMFHGLWSIAGFISAGIGTWLSGIDIPPVVHFAGVCVVFLITIAVSARYLVVQDQHSGDRAPLLALPDKALLGLGMIAFCSMMVEGAMFDWSGIYFKNVIKVTPELTGLGYTVFMISMAAMRFVADGIAQRVGLQRILQISGAFAISGLLVAVLQPVLLPATFGFLLVGVGVSAVVPMVYSAAGKSKTMSPGLAITAVSSLGFMGFLVGPPAIGFLAELSSLRGSFLALSVMSLCVLLLATLLKFPVSQNADREGLQ